MATMTLTLFVVLAAALLCGSASAGAGFYGSKTSNVHEITKANFASYVLANPNAFVVEFYAPWCGHCKSLTPEYEKAAKSLKGIVPVGAINCDEEKELCGAFDIKGFPTIKVFPHEIVENPYQKGQPWKNPLDYQGARTASPIANWALRHLPNYVEAVTAETNDEFVGKEGNNAILFSTKKAPSNLYKAVAAGFHGRMEFGQVVSTDKDLVAKYGIEKFPTLIVVHGDDDAVEVYAGDLKKEAISKFLNPYVSAKPEGAKPSSSSSSGSTSKPASDVVAKATEINNQADWAEQCTSTNWICLVAFLDEEADGEEKFKEQLAALDTLAHKFRARLRFFWADGPTHYQTAEQLYMSSGFPALAILAPEKKLSAAFVGVFSEEKILTWIETILRGGGKRVRLAPITTLPTFPEVAPAAEPQEADEL